MSEYTSVRSLLAVACGVLLLSGPLSAQGFNDDFDRADGPVDGWTVYQGEWAIAAGGLTTTAAGSAQGQESWVWAGDPPALVTGDFQASLDVDFVNAGAEVGQHGGIMLFASMPTLRWAEGMNGYTVDWLGNGSGFRLIRWDNGAFTVLVGSTPEITTPPSDWSVEVHGESITFSAGGQTVFEVADGTYREGHFGLWAYGTGQQIVFDNVVVSAQAAQAPALTPPGLFVLAAFVLVAGLPLLRRKGGVSLGERLA